jgi:hypothetical protein
MKDVSQNDTGATSGGCEEYLRFMAGFMVAIKMLKTPQEAILFLMFDMENSCNGGKICSTSDQNLTFRSEIKTSTLTRKFVGFQGYKSLNTVSYLHLLKNHHYNKFN